MELEPIPDLSFSGLVSISREKKSTFPPAGILILGLI